MKKNFAYFDKPIEEVTDQQLISFYIMFCNGADPNDPQDVADYEEFKAHIKTRSQELQDKVKYIDSVL